MLRFYVDNPYFQGIEILGPNLFKDISFLELCVKTKPILAFYHVTSINS